jgi:hypothetical protein
LTSDSNSIVVELTDDPAIITECRTSALRQGKCLVCRRCESNLSIAAIMILPIGGSIRLPLCADCLRELPAGWPVPLGPGA